MSQENKNEVKIGNITFIRSGYAWEVYQNTALEANSYIGDIEQVSPYGLCFDPCSLDPIPISTINSISEFSRRLT